MRVIQWNELTGVAFVSCLPYVVLLMFEAGSYYAALAGTLYLDQADTGLTVTFLCHLKHTTPLPPGIYS